MKINNRLNKLISKYPFGGLSELQKKSLSFILNKLGNSTIKDLRQQSYVLATIRHETGETYRPIKEYGSEVYLKNKKYYPFIGRGYCQITWRENYKKFGELIKIDLLTKPDLALDPDISWQITELGMTKGLFTGKKLDDYFNIDETDWFNARRIINILDKAEHIANIAKEFYHTLITITDNDIPDAKGLDK